MADDGEELRAADRVHPTSAGGRGRNSQPPAPPPRPPISRLTPPPVTRPAAPPPAIRATRSLLIASFILGFVAIAVAFLFRLDQVEELRKRIAGLMPEETDGTVERVVAVVFWASIAAVVVVIVTQALLLRLVMNRRRGVRWFLLVVLAIHAVVAGAAAAFLGAGDAGPYLLILLGGQFVLAGLAWVASVLPGTSSWFRRQH